MGNYRKNDMPCKKLLPSSCAVLYLAAVSLEGFEEECSDLREKTVQAIG